MKQILIVLVIVSIFMSCDGRKSHNEALKNSIEKFRDSIELAEIAEYIPKEYSEIVTDTILNNGFKVSIKTYTDMKKSVAGTYQEDSTIFKNYYREWISEVMIQKDNKTIFNEIIDRDFFLKNKIKIDEQLANAIHTGIWIEDEKSLAGDSIYLITGYMNPDNDIALAFSIKIKNDGSYYLEKLNLILNE